MYIVQHCVLIYHFSFRLLLVILGSQKLFYTCESSRVDKTYMYMYVPMKVFPDKEIIMCEQLVNVVIIYTV